MFSVYRLFITVFGIYAVALGSRTGTFPSSCFTSHSLYLSVSSCLPSPSSPLSSSPFTNRIVYIYVCMYACVCGLMEVYMFFFRQNFFFLPYLPSSFSPHICFALLHFMGVHFVCCFLALFYIIMNLHITFSFFCVFYH